MSDVLGEQPSSSGNPAFIWRTKSSSFSTCASLHLSNESGWATWASLFRGMRYLYMMGMNNLLTSALTPFPLNVTLSPGFCIGFVASNVISTVSPGQAYTDVIG